MAFILQVLLIFSLLIFLLNFFPFIFSMPRRPLKPMAPRQMETLKKLPKKKSKMTHARSLWKKIISRKMFQFFTCTDCDGQLLNFKFLLVRVSSKNNSSRRRLEMSLSRDFNPAQLYQIMSSLDNYLPMNWDTIQDISHWLILNKKKKKCIR